MRRPELLHRYGQPGISFGRGRARTLLADGVRAPRSNTERHGRGFKGFACRPYHKPDQVEVQEHRAELWASLRRKAAALAASLLVCSGTLPAQAARPSVGDIGISYEQLAQKRSAQQEKNDAIQSRPVSNFPSGEEAEALAQFDRDLFTPDAYEGMQEIVRYARYVDSLAAAEEGCEACTPNRLILEKAWQVVSNEFYDPHQQFSQATWAKQLQAALKAAGGLLPTKHMLYSTAEAMVGTLGDQYSEFLPPSPFRRALRRPQPAERAYLAAQFTGVGLAIGQRVAAGWKVEAALAESPAEQAGILRGEVITDIDNYVTGGLTKDEMVALLRGPAGSTVSVAIAAGPEPTAPVRTLELERRPLPQPAVRLARLRLPDGRAVSYARLHFFSGETARALQQVLAAGESDGVAGYVWDLRNNPGGVFEDAIAIASFLLEDGCPVAETVRSEELIDNTWQVGALSREIFPSLPGTLSHRPLVLLTNTSTASASEVLAGALHDNHRATIIGERTFGKGVVQYYFPMPDGSGLKLTVAKYLTPNRYDITTQGGLRPDVACTDYPRQDPAADPDSCLQQALRVVQAASAGTPTQLGKPNADVLPLTG